MTTIHSLQSRIWYTDVALGEYDVRGALIVGDERAFVWDTLSHPRDMRGYLPLIGDRELVIAYSHADWDHVWGTAGLPHLGAAILGHSACLARFAADVPVTLRERQAAEPGLWDDVRLVAPTRVFDGETSVAMGSMTVTVHHLPGHTQDSCVAFAPERGLLLMGDAAETPFPVVPDGCPLGEWITDLEFWAGDSRVQTVVPAHGAIGGREILRQNILYLEGLRDGRPIEITGPLTGFYRTTHESNLRAACQWGQTRPGGPAAAGRV
jgi:glyoxylase-like metal-dependent hydrolase (beta-lactamase superfamily II)